MRPGFFPAQWPNVLSALRILLTPVLVVLVLSESSIPNQVIRVVLIVLLYTALSLSDFFDGWLSRRYGYVSRLGQFLDPLADKFFTLSVYASFLFLPFLQMKPALVGAILVREVLVTGIRIVGLRRDRPMETERHGKVKTVVQIVSQSLVWLALLSYAIAMQTGSFRAFASGGNDMETAVAFFSGLEGFWGAYGIFVAWAPRVGLAVACAITLWSGYEYLKKNLWIFRSSGERR